MIDVAVVGSLHLDIVVAAPRLPLRDETLIGSAWRTKCGGKGGNQAVAAAQFGARVAFGGRIGKDDFGERLRGNLGTAGINISCLTVDQTLGSGMSVAISEATGDYGAVVVSGANLAIAPEEVANAWQALWQAKILLLQNEVPEPVNLVAAAAMKAAGGMVILNAAPARHPPPALLDCIDFLIVNRIEAEMLTSRKDPDAALGALGRPGLNVILTRGAEGLSVITRDGAMAHIPAKPVRQISTHGAGDFFCGVLAARLAAGASLEAACRYGSAAAALLVSREDEGRAAISHRDVEAILAT